MKTIYFVRHGQTDSNLQGIVSGADNVAPLNETGRQQAKQAGEKLQGKGVELIVCSPLLRTVETAQIIADEIGYDAKKIVRNPLFIERNCGIYDNGPEAEYFADLTQDRLHPSVETTEQMYARLTRALNSLKGYKEDTILVVSHGGTSRAVRAVNDKIHHTKMYETEKIANAELYEFTI